MKYLYLSILILTCLLLFSCSKDDGPIGPTTEVESITTNENLINLFTGEVVGTSKLVRTESLIQMEVVANNLIPGHVYNLGCFVYNKPEKCEGICGPEEYISSNSEVQVVGFLVAGKEAKSATETFTATLKERDITSYGMSLSAIIHGDYGGLQDAQKATISLLIKSQGPAQAGQEKTNQLTTFTQSCFFANHNILDSSSRIPVEPGECAFIYDSQHVAPQ